MLSAEQLDNWFTYHPPTEETAPKYASIRDAEVAVITDVTQVIYETAGDTQQVYREINRTTRRFAEIIDRTAPGCADTTAAIRCVRLARNAFNEYVTQEALPPEKRTWREPRLLFHIAEAELAKARWQANSAIACGGK